MTISLIGQVVTLIKKNPDGGPDTKVQILGTIGPPLMCILSFHSTVAMNFYSWNKAYSLFPLTTFMHRTPIVTKPIGDKEAICISKYTNRAGVSSPMLCPKMTRSSTRSRRSAEWETPTPGCSHWTPPG